MRPETNKLHFTGRIWTIDSWDGEQFTVVMMDGNGNILDSITKQAWHSQQAQGQHRTQCEGSVGGW
jgi:hypothetical protein